MMVQRPYSGRTVSEYGERIHPVTARRAMHHGVDGIGGPNVAPEDGVPFSWQYLGNWGWLLKFRGDSGAVHLLAHNAVGGLLTPLHVRVAAGTPLAVQGATGLATGIHVHWEVHINGVPTDPDMWLANQLAYEFSTQNKEKIMANSGITSKHTGNHYRFFGPYGLPDRGVIIDGTRAYVFPNQGELSHFLNFNRIGTLNDVERVLEVVGGPSEKPTWNRQVFRLIAKIHGV